MVDPTEKSVAPRSLPPIPPPAERPQLLDPWPWAQPIRLGGWAERERFDPLLLALIALVATFVAFQGVATVATAVFLFEELSTHGVENLPAILAANPNVVFGANAVGQFVGLLMLTILFARLHTVDIFGYMRVRRTDPMFYLLAGCGLLALMPFVSFVGELMQHVPLPEFMRSWDQQQQELLAMILGAEVDLFLALLFVAVTPAICEEVVFRGYLQRNVERRLGAIWAIVVIGLAFGLFHLRFAEFVPLSILGIYLAYIVWVSGSVWTGVLVHLMNNGIAVVVSNWAQTRPEPIAIEEIAVPVHLAALGLLLGLGLMYAMLLRRRRILAPTESGPSPTRL